MNINSHIGFNKDANPDVVGTLRAAIEKINGAQNTKQKPTLAQIKLRMGWRTTTVCSAGGTSND